MRPLAPRAPPQRTFIRRGRTLFASADEIKGAQKLLQDFKEGAAPPHVTNADLWEAQKRARPRHAARGPRTTYACSSRGPSRRGSAVVQSAVHPDTNEIIPAPFRMSAFVPANIPIVAGMVVAPPTVRASRVRPRRPRRRDVCGRR